MATNKLEQTVEESRKAVVDVARAALAESLGGRAAEIPSALPDAIASGTGSQDEMRETTRRIFSTGKPLDLVLFDTDRIASYVFESSRPPVITGASTLLRELNDRIAEDHRRFVIFSGGGEGMLLVSAGRGEKVCRQIETLYASRTEGALRVTTGFIPVGPHDFVAGNNEATASGGVRLVSGTQAVLSRLRDQVRRRKDEHGLEPKAVAGDDKRCVSCRDRAAGSTMISKFRPDVPFDGPLCDPCARRWEVGRREIKGISFEELVEASGTERAKSKYIGFLYADGNAMGALFGRLASLAQFRFLSQAVREVFERLQHRAKETARKLVPENDELPFVSYLGGGDEAIWIVPGFLALRIASQLAAWIEEESKALADLPRILRDRTGLPHLTFGAGLVLCGYTYPVRYQYALAKELQKSAKSISYKSGKPISAIDFEVLTESSPLSESLKSARALTDATEEPKFWRSCRPYTSEAFARLLERMARLRAADIKLATSQLYALQDGVREGRKVFLNFLGYQIARKPAGEKYQKWMKALGVNPADRSAIEGFFIQQLADGSGTWITDGLQLAPFLEGKEG